MTCLMFDVAAAMVLVQPVRASLDPCGTEELKCVGKDANSQLPFPENCQQYLRCRGTKVSVEDCPAGQYFDTVSLSCTTDSYQCQDPCPEGIYRKYLNYPEATTVDAATTTRRRRPTPKKTTTAPRNSATTTQTTFTVHPTTTSGRADGLSTESSTTSVPPFQTSTTVARTQQTTSSVRRDTITSSAGHVTTVAMDTATRVAVTSEPTHAQQTTSQYAITVSRDVTTPRHDVMTGTLLTWILPQ